MGKIGKGIKRYGFGGYLKYAIKGILGIRKIEESVDTLYYYLNTYRDVSDFPIAKDENVRNLQLGLLELLKIFDKLCRREGLVYWLDSGTLLGAVRHKGFIPWDDDLDVAMPREDYEKIIPLFKEEMEKYGIIVRSGGYFDNVSEMGRLAFAYKTLETGIWLDIFPIDFINTKKPLNEMRADISSAICEYMKYFRKADGKTDVKKIASEKNRIFKKHDNLAEGDYKIAIWSPEFDWGDVFYSTEDTIPVTSIMFEGMETFAPANPDANLREMYGASYMRFPQGGILHHADPDGQSAYLRAQRSKTDMSEVIKYLRSVYDSI